MLTLQMIQLMENLWKKEGLDLRYYNVSAAAGADVSAPFSLSVNAEPLFLPLQTQDDPIWLLVHWEQNGTHRGCEELRHHRQYPTQQQ